MALAFTHLFLSFWLFASCLSCDIHKRLCEAHIPAFTCLLQGVGFALEGLTEGFASFWLTRAVRVHASISTCLARVTIGYGDIHGIGERILKQGLILNATQSFSRAIINRDADPPPFLDTAGSTNTMEMLEKLGGLSQPEFKRAEEREQDSMGFSCLAAVRMMQETGRFDEAHRELEKELEKAKAQGPFAHAISSCMIAELLNRWGATTFEFSGPLMEQASSFAATAVDVLKALVEEYGTYELETALFWKALNLSTLSGNGGSMSSAADAMAMAESALSELKHLCRARDALPPEGQGRCDFVEGILKFNHAKAIGLGVMVGGEEDKTKLQRQALELFQTAYSIWEAEYGEEHPDTVKAVTMVAFSYKNLHNKKEALEWATKEFLIRVNIFGDSHPRTVHAKRCLRECQADCSAEGALQDEIVMIDVEGEVLPDLALEKYSAKHVNPWEITWETDPFTLEEDWMTNSILTMFESTGVSQAFEIPQNNLTRLILATKQKYRAANSFHNWRHAWSVTQSAYLITMTPSVMRCLGLTDRLAVLLSALMHDIDHPGVNSDFLIKSADPLAMKFPTPNVLERHHWGLCQQLLEKGSPTDILGKLDSDERQRVMNAIYDGIMATDMAKHKSIVGRLQERGKKMQHSSGPAYDPTDDEERRELLQSVLHTSDLSAQSMPATVAYQFGKGIIEEFHAQYMRERREFLPQSAFMKDMHKPIAQAKAQLGFLHYVAGPLWKAFSMVFNEFFPRYINIKERAKEIDFDMHQWAGLHRGLTNSCLISSCSARSLSAHSRTESSDSQLKSPNSASHVADKPTLSDLPEAIHA